MIETTIVENIAEYWSGGAIFVFENSTLNLSYCTINGNFTNNAGSGIYCANSIIVADELIISENTTNAEGILGGGIYLDGSILTINGGQITNHEDFGYGSGIYLEPNSEAYITGVQFSGNTASDGGGAIYSDNSILTLSNVTFSENIAQGDGGAMAILSGTRLTLNNVISWNNSPDELFLYVDGEANT